MQNYLSEILKYFQDTNSSEHSYRTSFENYLKEIFPVKDGYFTQQDQKSVNGNKPDFVIIKNKIPILYIEVKKVEEDLDKIEKSNQAERYFGYDNLIISNYVEFRFYRFGKPYGENISLGNINKKDRKITQEENSQNISVLKYKIVDFAKSNKERIKSAKHLAEIMGGKARRIRDNVSDMLSATSDKYVDLFRIRDFIRDNLVSDLPDEKFADMYAQTLIYGLFVARHNDASPDSFSRQEARDLVPKTNPFLYQFFDHIAGASFPDRLRYIVDEMCEVFSYANISDLLSDFYKNEKSDKDPIIHFYEDFLHEYDAKKKMDMGVFYTPKPVVDFIVRSVDHILKNDFGIYKGLADSSYLPAKKGAKNYHKVQILDVATGTGTFLNQIVLHIYKSFENNKASWPSYVRDHLIPRLHGFELMMASYTIAHLKIGLTLDSLNSGKIEDRIRIFLTNSLEAPKDTNRQTDLFGFQDAINNESLSASEIKKDYPIMCVVGNPPYSGESMNRNYIDNNIYKVEIGGKEKLKERNSKWINDDYVKFIRFGESLIEKNENGVLAMITAHGYIDNPTFRGMRWHLKKTFDKIYVLDLHGNSRKKEVSPDGSKDENVFDIMTGVSIIFGIKNKDKINKIAEVLKADFYGDRKSKFEMIENSTLSSIDWQDIAVDSDLWKVEGKGKKEYQKGFSVAELFTINSVGVVTAKDDILINLDKEELLKNVYGYYKIDVDENSVQSISYRPFDNRYIYYDTKLVERSREKVMSNFVNKDNLGLVFKKGDIENKSGACIISDSIIDFRSWSRPGMQGGDYISPLYVYLNEEKIPNLKKEIWDKINEKVGETSPEEVLYYIYAVLHDPKYREKYKEFLKIDFPRVPYPIDKKEFERLIKIGQRLCELHLMTAKDIEDGANKVGFNVTGDNVVEKVKYENGNVYINKDQYFENVPLEVFEFYVGGYQPVQKYLKDRKGRALIFDEIEHYRKIIYILEQTIKSVKEI